MRRKERTISVAFVIVGAILGSVLGEVLGAYYPFMRAGLHFGIPDFTLQLGFMELRLGLTLEHEPRNGRSCTALSLLLDARMRVYLASSSPRRAHMLADWGVPFSIVKADVDEVMIDAAPEN